MKKEGEVQLDSINIQMATEKERRLPSRFDFGDKVQVHFNDAGTIKNCEVIKIHFTESKVFYDVSVKSHYAKPSEGEAPSEFWDDDEHAYYTRLYNIDSAIVSPMN